MNSYLVLFLVVFGVNLMPAFGPPTWTIITLYGLNGNLSLISIVLVSALASASGRFLLSYAFRHLGSHLPERVKRNLTAARKAIQQRRRNMLLVLGLFALSPLPSAQLFEAAGLAGARLVPFTLAFFAGRTITYTLFALTAHELRQSTLGDALRSGFTSPIAVSIQLVMIGLLVLFAKVDWASRLGLADPQAGKQAGTK